MKKRIIQCLAIFVINVVVTVLAFSSFLLYWFKGDPILASLPAIVALPAVILQPWFFYFFLQPKGLILAPFLTTAVSVPLYIFLDPKGWLERAKNILVRLKSRKTFVIAGLFLTCLCSVGFTRYIDYPALRLGVPQSLQSFTQDMNLSLADSRYYCLGRFLDSEWLWKTTLSAKDMHQLADKLKLQPFPAKQIGNQFHHMPPYWWRPAISEQVQILATPDFPMKGRGTDGLNVLAVWNPRDEVLYMWIKDNF